MTGSVEVSNPPGTWVCCDALREGVTWQFSLFPLRSATELGTSKFRSCGVNEIREKPGDLSAFASESLDVVLELADVGIDLIDGFRSLALSGIGAAVRLVHSAFEAVDSFPK